VDAKIIKKERNTMNLYRHFDSYGNLLYVGISMSAFNRLIQHKDTAHWFSDISSITISKYVDKEHALVAEKLAIQNERPKYNMVHNGNRKYDGMNPHIQMHGELFLFAALSKVSATAGSILFLLLEDIEYGEYLPLPLNELAKGIGVCRQSIQKALENLVELNIFDTPVKRDHTNAYRWKAINKYEWASMRSELIKSQKEQIKPKRKEL
jgi:predicted transcriptional regulator